MSEWNDAKAYIPTRTGKYIVRTRIGAIMICEWHKGCKWPDDITHWMHLPEPPKPEGRFSLHDTGRIVFHGSDWFKILDLDKPDRDIAAELNEIWERATP